MLQPALNRLVEGSGTWNFDLEDCDNILRVETRELHGNVIVSALRTLGFYCEEIE